MDAGEASRIGSELMELLRLDTYPVAVRLVRRGEGVPEGVRRPSKALGCRITLCQAFGMTRRYGWTIGVSPEECACNVAKLLFGWSTLEHRDYYVDFLLDAGFFRSRDAAAKAAEYDFSNCVLPRGECEAILTSPLNRCKIEPDVALVHGNPTQVFILVHGYLSGVGGDLKISYTGRHASCGHGVIQTYLSRRPNIVIPDEGDCVLAATEKDELIFAAPVDLLPDILEGVKAVFSRKLIRYPTPYYIKFEPVFPEPFRRLGERLR